MTRTSSRPHEVIIGLDVGTTATKAVVFGLDSSWRYAAVAEYPLLEPVPGWQVQDPETVLAAVVSSLADCVTTTDGAEIIAISVSTAMHGLIGLDSAMRPLTPLVTWADGRSYEEARELRDKNLALDLQRTSGTPIHPMTPLTKLIWFHRHQPDTASEVRWWVGLKDYVLWNLTGTLATELSSASGTGLLNLHTRSWNPAAVALAGVSSDQLPPVLPTTAVLRLSPAAAARLGLPTGTPVVVGAGDGALGNLGTAAMSSGVVGLSLGTSAAARTIVSQPRADPDGALFCYALTDSAWAVGGAVSNGGIVVRWAASALAPDLSDIVAGPTVDEQLLALADRVPPGSDGLIMLPYLLPERAPLWDPALPGAYLGLRRAHTRGHLVRAAIEGVCLQLSTIVDRLQRIQPVTSVRVTGGAFRSAVWLKVMAAVLDRPLYSGGHAEGTALGAAALGLYALGRCPRLEDAPAMLTGPQSPATVRFDPDPQLVAAYSRTRTLVPQLVGALAPVAELFRDSPH
jgi:gluconokinase